MVDLVKPTNGPDKIYLDTDESDERTWCRDDDPAGVGYPWIEYIRHDVHDAALSQAKAEIERLREALTRQKRAWTNVLELHLISDQHRTSAKMLRDEAARALGEKE